MKLIDILDATAFPVGYRIAFITNFMREPQLRKMERETGLIRPELTVLMCLSFKRDVNARDICEITEQPSNTISRAVSSLAKKGCISRQKDEVDNRRQVLNITSKGQSLHDHIMLSFAATEAKMLDVLTLEEREVLLALLDKVSRNVEDWR